MFVIFLAILSCSNGENAVVPDTPIRILALGDSYTVGERVGKLESWPVQLVRELRSSGRGAEEPTIVAATGWDTDDLAQGLQLVDLQTPFDVVTLQIGVNNQFRGGTVSDFETELSGLIESAIDFAGGDANRVVLLSIPDWGVTPFADGAPKQEIAAEIDQFNDVIRDLAMAEKVRFISITEISRRAASERELIADDGLHPSTRMYSEWVELILPVIEEITE